MKNYYLWIIAIMLTSCSVIAKDNTPSAQYKVLSKAENENIELRVYKSMVLISAPMNSEKTPGRNSAFMKLFDYISGENISSQKISMTTPVFMDKESGGGTKIPMTAPVFRDSESENEALMSFVLPDNFTLQAAPKPINTELKLHELKDYKVAVITFSGLLSKSNIKENKEKLEKWISNKGYNKLGSYKTAGYNPPFTLPPLRRNEVLIPVDIK